MTSRIFQDEINASEAEAGAAGDFNPRDFYIANKGDPTTAEWNQLSDQEQEAYEQWFNSGGPKRTSLLEGDPDWWKQARRWLLEGLGDYAKQIGYPSAQFTAWLDTVKPQLIERLGKFGDFYYGDRTDFMDPFTDRRDRDFLRIAWNVLEENLPALGRYDPFISDFGLSGGSRGSGKAPKDIRKNFDIEELTIAANNLWRGYLLEEGPDMRAVAKEYVERVVADPEQRLDFDTFVYGKLKNTARYAMMYGNKPEGMSEAQFIQPYLQAAQQVIGPGFGDQLNATAIGGARLHASPAAFSERLKRTDQALSSVGFFQHAGNALQSVSRLFQGS